MPTRVSGSDGGHLRTKWDDRLEVDSRPGSAAPLRPVEDCGPGLGWSPDLRVAGAWLSPHPQAPFPGCCPRVQLYLSLKAGRSVPFFFFIGRPHDLSVEQVAQSGSPSPSPLQAGGARHWWWVCYR